MKSRSVLGKRIVRIHQGFQSLHGSRLEGESAGRPPTNVVDALELEDGTLLVPYTIETEDADYAHDFRVERPKTARKAKVGKGQ